MRAPFKIVEVRHRWPVSLLCSLLALAALCWFGWQWRIVYDRRDTLDWIARRNANDPAMARQLSVGLRDPQYDGIPWLRLWLGDRLHLGIVLREARFDNADIERIRRTFPEATIYFGE